MVVEAKKGAENRDSSLESVVDRGGRNGHIRLLGLDETVIRAIDGARSYLAKTWKGSASPEERGKLAKDALATASGPIFEGDAQLEVSYSHHAGNDQSGFFDYHIRRFVEYADRNGWHVKKWKEANLQ